MVSVGLWLASGLAVLALALFVLAGLTKRHTDRLRQEYHGRRDELVAEARALVGAGQYVFATYFESILYIGSDRPVLVKITRRNGGLERIVVEGAHILGVRLEPDPVERYKKKDAPLGPQFDRLLVVSLIGPKPKLTFYFDTSEVAREWLHRTENVAASAGSGSTTLRS